jgi:hypothetical protein
MTSTELADRIEKHIPDLTSVWIEAVRAEPRIQSDSELSEDGLRNHIPAVIEEICEMLHSGKHPDVTNTREARVHAYVRFRQGYRARELVRELSLLRLVLLDHISSGLFGASASLDIEAYIEVTRIINLYIDEEMSYAVSVYAEAIRASNASSESGQGQADQTGSDGS